MIINPVKLNSSEIAKTGVRVIKAVLKTVQDFISCDSEIAFEEKYSTKRRKYALRVDELAEDNGRLNLYRSFGKKHIIAYGEENFRKKTLDLSNEKRLVALVDMLDGTDLLKRGLSNWCSAMILFYPAQRKIVGAFVGIPSDGVYYAIPEYGVYKQPMGRKKPHKLKGHSKITKLKNASICFYGQKIKNLLSIAGNRKFIKNLQKMEKVTATKRKKMKLRIYNLAGTPMMVKLSDGIIDAVFDIEGQAPHDVAPGAYIATQTGAVFKDLNDKPVDLLSHLLRPGNPKFRLRYILASTEKLFKEIHAAITQ